MVEYCEETRRFLGSAYNIPDNNLFQRIVKDFIDQRFSTKFVVHLHCTTCKVSVYRLNFRLDVRYIYIEVTIRYVHCVHNTREWRVWLRSACLVRY